MATTKKAVKQPKLRPVSTQLPSDTYKRFCNFCDSRGLKLRFGFEQAIEKFMRDGVVA